MWIDGTHCLNLLILDRAATESCLSSAIHYKELWTPDHSLSPHTTPLTGIQRGSEWPQIYENKWKVVIKGICTYLYLLTWCFRFVMQTLICCVLMPLTRVSPWFKCLAGPANYDDSYPEQRWHTKELLLWNACNCWNTVECCIDILKVRFR